MEKVASRTASEATFSMINPVGTWFVSHSDLILFMM
jgi:hypothetical protein